MKKSLSTTIKVLLIPVLYAIILRIFFGVGTWQDLFSVMSLSFLFCLPLIVGVLVVYFSPIEKAVKKEYQIFTPWFAIFLFFVITIVVNLEGWACWLMALPLFLIGASIGGLIGGYLKKKKHRQTFKISVLVLLPFLFSPIEQLLKAIPGTYSAYTYIDIQSKPESIWQNVTRVSEIAREQDKGWLTRTLGFPRPIKAELNYEGVGAYREAIFSKGLVFHETVTHYEPLKKMEFTIKANPYEIPSTTLDEHITIGGRYFDILNGTYQLEELSGSNYRLHLYSQFTLSTTFNFYASWWACWIMKDIQSNILQIIKKRAEGLK